jgi:hypothetical protein
MAEVAKEVGVTEKKKVRVWGKPWETECKRAETRVEFLWSLGWQFILNTSCQRKKLDYVFVCVLLQIESSSSPLHLDCHFQVPLFSQGVQIKLLDDSAPVRADNDQSYCRLFEGLRLLSINQVWLFHKYKRVILTAAIGLQANAPSGMLLRTGSPCQINRPAVRHTDSNTKSRS